MKTRTKAALLSVAVATTLVVAAAGPSGAAAGKSFAYGFSVNGQGKQPYVESTDGSTHHGQTHFPDQASQLVSGGIVDLSAGNDKASAAIADVSLLNVGDQIPQQLKDGLKNLQSVCDGIGGAAPTQQGLDQLNAGIDQLPGGTFVHIPSVDEVQGFCNSLVNLDTLAIAHVDALSVQCTGDTGTVNLAGVTLLGAKVPGIDGDVAPNTPLIPENGGFDVMLNRQTPNPDGSFTVDGLVIDLGGGQGEIVLASATCGKRIVDRTTSEKPPHNAPAPSPVHRSLGVTG